MPEIDFFSAFGPVHEATRSKSGATGATGCYSLEITGVIPVAPVAPENERLASCTKPDDDTEERAAIVARLERAVFVADKSDTTDTKATVTIALDTAGMSDMADDGLPLVLGTTDSEMPLASDAADAESSVALCRTAADKSDSQMPACGTIAVQTRLSGDAKAEIISALGISLATLNRALAE